MSRLLNRRQSQHPNLAISQRNLEALQNSHRERDTNGEDKNGMEEANQIKKTKTPDQHHEEENNKGNLSNDEGRKTSGEHANQNVEAKRRVRKQSDEGDDDRLAKVMMKSCKVHRTVAVGVGAEEVDIYQIPTQSVNKNGLTEYSIVSPRTVHGTHTKVLVLFETPHGANSSSVLNMLINFVFGVSFDDSFRLELSIAQKEGDRNTFMVHIPCQDGGGVRFNVLAIVAGQLEPTTKLVGLLQIMQLVSDKRLDHIDSYIATFNGEISSLDDSDVSVLSSFQSTSSPEQRFMVIVPSEKAFEFGEQLRSEGLRNVETCGLDYEPQTEAAHLQNASVWRSLLAKLTKAEQKSTKTGLSTTEQRVHLEDNAMFALQSLRIAFDDLLALRRDLDVLEKHKNDVLKSKAFSGSYDVPQVVSIPVQCTNTYCLRCQVVCHENCCMNSDTNVYLCAAMATPKDDPQSAFCHYGKCNGVPLGCHWTDHKNMKQTKLVKQLKTSYSSTEIAAKYDKKEDLRGLDKQLVENFDKKMFNFMSSLKKSRDALKKLQEASEDKKSLSAIQENQAEMEREMKEMQRGYMSRVEALLDFNELELQSHQDAAQENSQLSSWESKQRSGAASSRFPEETRRTKINVNTDDSESVDSDQKSRNGRTEQANADLESIYGKNRVPSTRTPRIMLSDLFFRSRATSAQRPKTVRAKTALAAGKRRTTISWVDDIESYWFDHHSGRNISKPSVRERLRKLRSVREHYTTAALLIKPKRPVSAIKK